MSTLVDNLRELSDSCLQKKDNLKKLSLALGEYHRLVSSGLLIPRSNKLQTIYKVNTFTRSNIPRG